MPARRLELPVHWVGISPSMWSQIKSSRPIGDKLAGQIEQHHGKPAGWLDEVRDDAAPTSAEKAFLELALSAWRSTKGTRRKALRVQLETLVKGRQQSCQGEGTSPASVEAIAGNIAATAVDLSALQDTPIRRATERDGPDHEPRRAAL